MKIHDVTIENYRCLKALTLTIDGYTALVGANGTGKSSVLYALNWFFNGGSLAETDVHNDGSDDGGAEVEDRTVSVAITFADLTDRDRARLKEYGRGDLVRFRRSWKVGDAKDKVVGNALQGRGFADLRRMTRVGEFRPAYVTLRQSLTSLPDLGATPSKDEVHQAIALWESDAANKSLLVSIDDDDANHMFGINGPNILRECVRLVLIPAATNIADQVGSAGKNSALAELIGSVMTQAGSKARAEWVAANASEIARLNQLIRDGIESSTSLQASRVNSRLSRLVPNAKIAFNPVVPDWSPKAEASVTTDVTIDGTTNDVSRQGHGVQRAVMIAMFQSLVPDAEFTTATIQHQEGETDDQSQARLTAELADLPTLIVCIEEPEIYQHPIRARSFARVLCELATHASAQVLIATHSPYFVRPELFSALRRFYMHSGTSEVFQTDADKVALAANCSVERVRSVVNKRVPTTFSEGFFADKLVLVEGDTDRAIVEALAERLGTPLDVAGVSVVDLSGKENLRIPYCMLLALGSQVYVLVDGDALGAGRRHADSTERQASARASHQRSTEEMLAWLPSAASAHVGSLPYSFGDASTVTDSYAIWQDDIEHELEAWPSFMAALEQLGSKLRSHKDALAYRTAVLEAQVDDLPSSLKACIDAIVNFAQ